MALTTNTSVTDRANASATSSTRPARRCLRYRHVRATTLQLCEPLEVEDYVVQSMPDASPAKWHLAHTSWFFEQFLLKPMLSGYQAYHEDFEYLFNSYYQSVGPMHQRPRRGLLSRPTVQEIMRYRMHVDRHIESLLDAHADDDQLAALLELGVNHEQQHQELLLTDIKHLFSCNPLLPAYRSAALRGTATKSAAPTGDSALPSMARPMTFIAFDGGVQAIGAPSRHGRPDERFCFDNEQPRHRLLVAPFALADRLVTSGEYLDFIRDGGYRRATLWLSDGWQTVTRHGWNRPLYWSESLDAEFTLAGLQDLDNDTPVSHLSYYEADAFARWAGARLPTEAEWELAAAGLPVQGNLLEAGTLHPRPARAHCRDRSELQQLFGDTWEWTASPYVAYPGYRSASGALGEYNGKFMCNQWVLRGGSCATPAEHIRASYRNFFYPDTRWQFAGLRLACNA
ncbi:hypothetical protein ACG33_12780 [Steroidobacter denitrificans]|uniref:Ergothioneine biosynthesis protein EgtB n=1 Tax=Steroidobacter denitrificans TaxID=465721 RepID=A0A127FDY8_STEDE|nr:ergothioneine biosynthesis protein EgtB [Steroidobacter denitrificans]AMN47955.1 hypothetical protein ACG33_12780 [Steroidobacter denitrificans]